MWFFTLASGQTPDFAALAEASFRVHHLGRSNAAVELDTDVLRWGGGAKVRVHPRIAGLRIDRASQVVSFDPHGGELRISGPSLFLAAPTLGAWSRDEAIQVATAVPLGKRPLWRPRAEEVFLLIEGAPRHAWAVDVGHAEPLSTWRVWVDAVDGTVLSLDRTGHAARGRIYDPSPLEGDPVDVELRYLDDESVLRGRYSDAFSCTEWTLPESLFAANSCDAMERRAVPQGGDYLYDPNEGDVVDPFTEVNLYHHVSRVAAYFEDRHGLRRTRPFTTIANFEMQNAFFGDFDGDGWADLSFGFSDGVQFGYDAEVVYHEYGHWVVARLADVPSLTGDEFGLDWIGGSINEGAADVFSMLLEPDPDLGAYAGLGFRDGPIRALEEDRTCPADLAGEVHVDGEILGSLGWNLIQALGTDKTGDLMVGAVASWGPDVDWTKVAESLLDAADDLVAAGVLTNGDRQVVVEAVETSQMNGCPRVIPLDGGQSQRAFVLSGGLQGDLYRIPGQNQFSIDVPANAERVEVSVQDFRGAEGLVWSLMVRAGQPIENAPSNLAGLGLGFSSPQVWDSVADGDAGYEVLVIDADSDPPLEPGQTYYLQVAGRTDGTIELFDFRRGRLEISAAVVTPAESKGACRTGPVPNTQMWRRR